MKQLLTKSEFIKKYLNVSPISDEMIKEFKQKFDLDLVSVYEKAINEEYENYLILNSKLSDNEVNILQEVFPDGVDDNQKAEFIKNLRKTYGK